MEGNARYVKGESRRHDFRHEREALSKGQNPFAAVLSCADSRIAPEYCFDTARGDLFVCRIAGNFASDEMVASLEYAVQVLNTPLILVLGHEACGAVDATIKSIKDGTTLPGHLPSLVDAIRPAVEAVQGQPGDLLDNAIRRNVALNVDKLKSAGADSEILRRRQENPRGRRHLRAEIRTGGAFELDRAASLCRRLAPAAFRRRVFVVRALMHRLARLRQIIGAVDQREMREGLRKIADQALELRIVFLAQQADIVAKPDQPPKQPLGLVESFLQNVGVDQPEAAGQERALARRQRVLDLLGRGSA